MVGAALGKEGFELLPDGLDEVRWECGHGACSFRSGSLENSPHDGASVPALHHDALPIDGSSKLVLFEPFRFVHSDLPVTSPCAPGGRLCVRRLMCGEC